MADMNSRSVRCRHCGTPLIEASGDCCPKCGRALRHKKGSLADLLLNAPYSLHGVIPPRDRTPMRAVDFGDDS
jgi:predicted amidophosphoribosyltransferase